MKIKLAAIAKNEGIYLPQWIFHHYKFGIRNFEIWLNQTYDDSIEILNRIRVLPDIDVKIVIADEILEVCRLHGSIFQLEAYNRILKETIAEKYDYLFFLDIDEFWTPKNLHTDLKTYLMEYPEPDAISFRWAFDLASKNQALACLPSEASQIQLNDHVKSIIKISERVQESYIHNSMILDGNYILEDGTPFLEENSQDCRAIISELPKHTMPPDYFIFHAAYRSEKEYLARLLRGRKHANDQSVLKINRGGYLSDPNSTTMNWHIPEESRTAYMLQYKSFLQECNIYTLLDESKYVDSQVEVLMNLLSSDKALIESHYTQLRGIDFQPYTSKLGTTQTIKHEIDTIRVLPNGEVEIIGWFYDWFYPKMQINVQVNVGEKYLDDFLLARHERGDVQTTFPDAPLDCGFSICISPEIIANSSSLRLALDNGLNRVEIQINTLSGIEPKIFSHESYLRGSDLFRDLQIANLKFAISTIFDVGANIGQSCTEYLQQWPDSKIFCFEPSSRVFKILEDTHGEKTQVENYNLGLSDQCKTMAMVEEDISVNNHFIDSSLVNSVENVIDCEVVRGDCFILAKEVLGIDFLKIDTEGHDLKVLQGFHETLIKGMIGLIQCEVSMSLANQKHVYFEDVLEFIKPFGFEIFGFYEQIRTPGREFLRRTNLVLINYDYFQSTLPKLV